jgi:hypothetical protein
MNSCITRGHRMSVAAFLALRLLGLVVRWHWQVICIYVLNCHFEWRLWKRLAEARAQNLLDILIIPSLHVVAAPEAPWRVLNEPYHNWQSTLLGGVSYVTLLYDFVS